VDARNAVSGSSERPSKRQRAPANGGRPDEAMAMIARLSETVSRQAEAIRILADRVNTLEGRDEGTDDAPTHYLNGKPKF
jgi:hypothetical protein